MPKTPMAWSKQRHCCLPHATALEGKPKGREGLSGRNDDRKVCLEQHYHISDTDMCSTASMNGTFTLNIHLAGTALSSLIGASLDRAIGTPTIIIHH